MGTVAAATTCLSGEAKEQKGEKRKRAGKGRLRRSKIASRETRRVSPVLVKA